MRPKAKKGHSLLFNVHLHDNSSLLAHALWTRLLGHPEVKSILNSTEDGTPYYYLLQNFLDRARGWVNDG